MGERESKREVKFVHRNLADILKQIRAEATESGEVICEFKLNSMSISEEDEETMADIPLTDIKNIERNERKAMTTVAERTVWIRAGVSDQTGDCACRW